MFTDPERRWCMLLGWTPPTRWHSGTREETPLQDRLARCRWSAPPLLSPDMHSAIATLIQSKHLDQNCYNTTTTRHFLCPPAIPATQPSCTATRNISTESSATAIELHITTLQALSCSFCSLSSRTNSWNDAVHLWLLHCTSFSYIVFCSFLVGRQKGCLACKYTWKQWNRN